MLLNSVHILSIKDLLFTHKGSFYVKYKGLNLFLLVYNVLIGYVLF